LPTLVEFLDFECESCGALYPHLEQLREQYEGRVTFAIHYFPMDQLMRDLNDPQAIVRINADKETGLQLGVTGTPTLFINEQLLHGRVGDDDRRLRLRHRTQRSEPHAAGHTRSERSRSAITAPSSPPGWP